MTNSRIKHYRDNINGIDIVLILSETPLNQTITLNDDKTHVFILNNAQFEIKMRELDKVIETNKSKTTQNLEL